MFYKANTLAQNIQAAINQGNTDSMFSQIQ